MSDFVPNELWDEIIQRHWTYCGTEESLVKLENRKKLEDCLKEFLCIVQHDRKFFLPETAKILKDSIRDMENFSAQKAIMAFESISQYANNLFTKPWRKEFRILKMYSGFYQHEIKSNILDAVKLFEAMGYRFLSSDTLILDGPICPDQVSNVSLDAMAAYVELNIIKNIYTSLNAIGINSSWLEIYRHREKYSCSTSQAVKAIAYGIEKKCYRFRTMGLAADNYDHNDRQPSSNYFATNKQVCSFQCQCNGNQKSYMSKHRPTAQPNDMCCVPENNLQPARSSANIVYSNMNFPTQHNNFYQHNNHDDHPAISNDSSGVVTPQMSHSRSLDYYSEPVNHHLHNILPQRHSFDHQMQGCKAQNPNHYTQQQQLYYQHLQQDQNKFYESPYDCIDGNSLGGDSSNISYAANTCPGTVATDVDVVSNCNINSYTTYCNPYNVSGNRIPLPLNISNQLSVYDNLQSSNYVARIQEPTYTCIPDQQTYSFIDKSAPICTTNSFVCNNSSASHMEESIHNTQLLKDSLQRDRAYQSEHLINFDDPSLQQEFNHLNKYRSSYQSSNQIINKNYSMENSLPPPPPPPVTTFCHQHNNTGKLSTMDTKYLYAIPTPRENQKLLQNTLNVRKSFYNSGDQADTTDVSYESANDGPNIKLPTQQNDCNNQHSPTQFSKNEDGVGSFASWNFVFQTLDRSDNTKDLGENKDLLMESLDLDSLNINNDTSPSQKSSAEKKRLNYRGNEKNYTSSHQHLKQLEPKQENKTVDNSKCLTKHDARNKISTSSSVNNSTQMQGTELDNNIKKIKSSLKQTNATSKTNNQPSKLHQKNDNKTSSKAINNNNNIDHITNSGSSSSRTTQRSKSSPTTLATSVPTTRNMNSADLKKFTPSTHSKQNIVTTSHEWSCNTCTFINPGENSVCDMCCHSKDFQLDTNSSNAARKTTVAHNTTTCA